MFFGRHHKKMNEYPYWDLASCSQPTRSLRQVTFVPKGSLGWKQNVRRPFVGSFPNTTTSLEIVQKHHNVNHLMDLKNWPLPNWSVICDSLCNLCKTFFWWLWSKIQYYFNLSKVKFLSSSKNSNDKNANYLSSTVKIYR